MLLRHCIEFADTEMETFGPDYIYEAAQILL